MTSMSDVAETSSTPVLDTSTVGPESPRETGQTEGNGSKEGSRNDDKDSEETNSGRTQDPLTPVSETSAVAPERQHKTGEMGVATRRHSLRQAYIRVRMWQTRKKAYIEGRTEP